MADHLRPIVLNANQRRHFEVLFARLEDSLARVDRLLDAEPARPQALSIDEQDIAESFREHATPIIDGLRKQIIQLATTLELRPRTLPRSRSVAATLSAEAIRIEESLSSQLRGYGAVDPTISQHLDPVLKQMAQALSALRSELEHHSPSARKP